MIGIADSLARARPVRRPGLPLRPLAGVRARLRATALDGRLAEGAQPGEDQLLLARAKQLVRPRYRATLAALLEALLDRAQNQPVFSSAIPVSREAVMLARPALLDLGERLRQPRPVRPQGVAIARWLLTDGAGPLYVDDGRPERLADWARHARFTLDGSGGLR